MQIERIQLDGVRGVRDGEHVFDKGGATIVSGPTGAGKSQLLKATMAAKERVGAYRLDVDFGRMVQNRRDFSRTTITWALTDSERGDLPSTLTSESTFGAAVEDDENDALLEDRLRTFRDDHAGVVFYVPARQRFSGPSTGVDWTHLRDCASTLDDTKLSWVSSAIIDASRIGEASLIELFRANLARFELRLTLHGVQVLGGSPHLVWKSGDQLRLGMDELSSTEALAVLFSGMFAFGGFTDSVFLFDSPEANVAVEAQPSFARALLALTKGNQAIIATSSPTLYEPGTRHIELRAEGAR